MIFKYQPNHTDWTLTEMGKSAIQLAVQHYQQANKDDIIECQIRKMEGDGGGVCIKPKWVWRANYSTDIDKESVQ